jgi:hypothetical protein
MMSVRLFRNQNAGNSTNSPDQIVDVDCSAVVRVWALYGVDGLLNYDLFFLCVWLVSLVRFICVKGLWCLLVEK